MRSSRESSSHRQASGHSPTSSIASSIASRHERHDDRPGSSGGGAGAGEESSGTGPSASTSTAYVSDKTDDSSRLKTFLSILRKFVGVSDIASVRFSLPAQLLEPTPNLEYWNYLDRPEMFIAIGDSDDELGRMLEVLRFWFTKDLKYVKSKPCKPYNSALGEFFRCNWDVEDSVSLPRIPATTSQGVSRSGNKTVKTSDAPTNDPSSTSSTTGPSSNRNPNDPHSNSISTGHDKSVISTSGRPVRVSYLTEQTSHHPPVSAFWVDCPVKGVSAYGFDQISAKFTGTSIRVTPGHYNRGIFINIARRNNEEYRMTHPVATLGGVIRGSLAISVADTCYLTCPQTRIKVILQYAEESWLGKAQNKVAGVIFRYDPANDTRSRIKDVPDGDVLARLEGNWHEEISFTLSSSKESNSLIDLRPLHPSPKIIPPISEQLPNESQRFWQNVTTAIKQKKFAEATKMKQDLEEEQREKVRGREKSGREWHPRFFAEATTDTGRPHLNQQGTIALKGLQTGQFHLDGIMDSGDGDGIGN